MKVFKAADRLQRKFKGIKIEKLDVVSNPHIALRHKLLYCPALVINDDIVFYGIPNERKLFQTINLLG